MTLYDLSKSYGMFGLAVVLAVAVLLVDVSFPLGVTGSVLYVGPILLGLWFPDRRQISIIVLLSIVLIGAGYVLSPVGGGSWAALTSRGIALLVVLVSGSFLFSISGKLKAAAERDDDERGSRRALEFFSTWRVATTFIILLSVLVVAFIVSWETERSLESVSRTREVQVELQKVLSLLQDTETGQRGFLLTGEESYLAPFEAAVGDVASKIAALKALTSDNPRLKRDFEILAPLVAEKIAKLRETISLRRTEGFENALAVVKTDVGKKVMDGIREVLQDMSAEEARLLSLRQDRFNRLESFALTAYVLSVFLVIGISIAVINRTREFIVYREVTDKRLRAAKEEAERANAAKSQFLSSMSHELRTPMNAILGFTQILRSDKKTPLTAGQMDATDQILKSGDHLLKLINEVLDLAQVESGNAHVTIEQQDPTPVVENCVTMARTLAKQKGLTFYDRTQGWKLPEIAIDETRFRQVLLNLLSNAVNYNRPNGTVTLAIGEGKTGMLRFSVVDNGVGIPKEKISQIFSPFSRLGLENSDITGTGIGLTITRQLTEAMGGTIGFESTVNVGSTFWLEFPVVSGELMERLPDTRDAMRMSCAAANPRRTVLCVEDSPSSLKLLETIIKRIPETAVISAHTGELGIDLAEIHRPNVIVMDINLPGITGIEALRRLQGSKLTKEIPVIALTARASVREKKHGLELGFETYLTKPINVEEVTSAITQAFDRA